jgi:hypothetical protein
MVHLLIWVIAMALLLPAVPCRGGALYEFQLGAGGCK